MEHTDPLLDPLDPPKRKDQSALKNKIVAAISNLSTAYNLTIVASVNAVLKNQYCVLTKHYQGVNPDGEDVYTMKFDDECKAAGDFAKVACIIGAIVGQIFMGYVGDCIGRSNALRLTMALSIGGALLSAFAFPTASDPLMVLYTFGIARLILGVGVGGVYPLAATVAAESSESKSRGTWTSFVFSMQGVGNILGPLVLLIFAKIFDPDNDIGEPGHIGWAWRCAIAFGAVPGLCIAPFKTKETQKKAAGEGNSQNCSTYCKAALGQRKYWFSLVGTAGGWFLFDITFYGNSLFAPVVLSDVFSTGGNNNTNATDIKSIDGSDLSNDLCLQLIVVAAMALPGYYVALVFMDRMGRKIMQAMGFFMMAVVYTIIGVIIHLQFDTKDSTFSIPAWALMALYGLTYFFSNFGPNSTTFILPSETFPPEVRTTLNGVSAAAGKIGAAIGVAAFPYVVAAVGKGFTLVVCGGVSMLGFIITLIFVKDMRGKAMTGSEEVIDDFKEEAY